MEKSENNKIEKGFPAPLFRDPIFDGASDPTVIWNRNEQCYYMFYTQRRSTSVQVGFSSIHGSKIGVATSKDKKGWLYRGTLENLDIEHGHNTFGHQRFWRQMEHIICMYHILQESQQHGSIQDIFSTIHLKIFGTGLISQHCSCHLSA